MQKHTELIANIARDVYLQLGSGHSEVVYDHAMQVGLRLDGIKYENQKVVELKYRDHHVGEGYPDLVVHIDDKTLVVELKAVAGQMGPCEEQQLRNYMKILDIELGVLINFQAPGKKGSQLDIREICL
jgi:GxxExxY protein